MDARHIVKYMATTTALALVGALVFTTYQRGAPMVQSCTAEARMCPDGSTVGREGPHCEFAACPNGDAMFVEEGTMVFNDPMQPAGPGSLVYEKDGRTLTKNLAMDAESMCVGSGTSILCMALSTSPDVRYAGERVRVSGIDRGADLLVRTIEIISGSTSASDRTSVTARVGQKVTARGVSITVSDVIEDSRCPQGVQCVWAGTVKATASLESGMGTAPVTFEIGFPISTEAEFVTLTGVSPAPFAGVEIGQSAYRLTFEITKRRSSR